MQLGEESAELGEATVLKLDSSISSETTKFSMLSESSSFFTEAQLDYLFSLFPSFKSTFIQKDTDVKPQSVFIRKISDENQRIFGSELMESDIQALEHHSGESSSDCKVMIGSISVTVEKYDTQQQSEPPLSETTKTDGHVSRSMLWRPVNRHRIVRDGNEKSIEDTARDSNERLVLCERCRRPCISVDNANETWNDSQEGTRRLEGFSTKAAKAFLQQRWKDAIAGDHVILALTPETELLDGEGTENDYQVKKPSSDSRSRTILRNAENLQGKVVCLES